MTAVDIISLHARVTSAVMATITAGRPRRSAVWNYFLYDKSKDISVCQVKISKEDNEVICGKELKGAFATNMKKHMKQQHQEAYQAYLEKESESHVETEVRKTTDSMRQTSIRNAIKPALYPKDSKKQQEITKKLAIFVGATIVPLSLIECPEFHDLLKELDKHYDIPGRKKLGKNIDAVYNNLKQSIIAIFSKVKRVSISSDIWTKKGMTASFLGVTAHCFVLPDSTRHNISIAVRRFESPHTGERIAMLLQTITAEWCIQNKIFRVLTDNGSNIVKAFHITEDTLADTMDASCDDTDDDHSDLDCSELENESDDTADEDDTIKIVEEMEAMEAAEKEHSKVTELGWKRNSCFVHTLQLVVKEFEKDPCFRSTLTKARKIIKKVNKSCKATELLVKLAGKKLISNCPTRWDSTYLMISRFISLKEHINTVLDKQGWDTLTMSQSLLYRISCNRLPIIHV